MPFNIAILRIGYTTILLLLLSYGSAGARDTVSVSTTDSLAQHREVLRYDTYNHLNEATYVGVPLVVAGLMSRDHDNYGFKDLRQRHIPEFRYHYDDFLQFAPAAAMLTMKIAGIPSRSSWGRMITTDAIGLTLLATSVLSIKHNVNAQRPDAGRNSFPSGHTATAFSCASMLHREYGYISPWIGIGAYSAATVTGLSRMANNRHWLRDVLSGAGIGIISTELAYYITDLIFRENGLCNLPDRNVLARSPRPSFIGINTGFCDVATLHRPDGELQAHSPGSSIAIEGAWFMNRLIGWGGTLAAKDVTLGERNSSSHSALSILSAHAGVYLAYALTPKLLGEVKLLFGSIHYLATNMGDRIIPKKTGISCLSGADLTIIPGDRMGIKFFIDYTHSTAPWKVEAGYINGFTYGCGVSARL